MAKGFNVPMVWVNSPEGKQRIAAAEAQALSEFKKRFSHADISRFEVEVEVDANRATGTVLFTESDGSQTDPLIKKRKYWSQGLRKALGFPGGFPIQLTPFTQTKPQMPIPAVDFSEEIDKSMYIGDVLNKELKIYVTPTDFFTTKFREIFKNTQITLKTAKYGRKWIRGPDLSFWPQQLNFALWCATTGCGISRDILFPTSYLNLSLQVRSVQVQVRLSIPRLFHNEAYTVRDRWDRECIRFTRRFHIQIER